MELTYRSQPGYRLEGAAKDVPLTQIIDLDGVLGRRRLLCRGGNGGLHHDGHRRAGGGATLPRLRRSCICGCTARWNAMWWATLFRPNIKRT